MVVRRSESVLLNRPPRRKDNKIGNGRSVPIARTRQHRENARIAMIEADRIDHHELGKIVLVRDVVSVPRHHIERRMILSCNEQRSLVLGHHLESLDFTIFEPRCRCEEITWIGQSIRSNRAQIRKLEVAIVDFQNVSSGGTFNGYAEPDTLRDHANLVRLNVHLPELGCYVQRTLLGN